MAKEKAKDKSGEKVYEARHLGGTAYEIRASKWMKTVKGRQVQVFASTYKVTLAAAEHDIKAAQTAVKEAKAVLAAIKVAEKKTEKG